MGDMSQHWHDGPRSTPNGDGSASRRLTQWSAALLSRFSVIWPKAWADLTALTPHDLLVAEWARGLEGLSAEQIRHGLDQCRANCPWPPAIAEFRSACHDGANAEQRAFAARARAAQEGRGALRHGTHAEVAAEVQEHLQAARAAREKRPVRSVVNIKAGKWTREMEANFRQHAQFLGYPVKPFECPDGEVW